MPKNYCIYEGYNSRTEFVTCNQTEHTDGFQDEVYEAARKLCVAKEYETILDIGCGSAFKLIKYFRDKKFIYNFTSQNFRRRKLFKCFKIL